MMNRIIKFRAWDIESPAMIEWDEIQRQWESEGYHPAILSSDHYHVMQFTGLKDKNGTCIFEGDIIKASGEYPAEIGFKFGTFLLRHSNHKGMNGISISDVATDRYEVIGNIYEHKHLIGEG